MKAFVAVLALVAAALADNAPAPQSYQRPAPQPSSSSYQPSYPDAPAQYNFQWDVKDDYSKNDYGQQEQRDGDSTKGSYYVALPDGRLQKVTYSVDGYGGFVADVTYEGEAQYDETPAPSYQKSQYKPAPAPAPRYPAPAPAPSYPAPAPEPSYQSAPAPAPEPSYQPAPAPAQTSSYRPAPAPAPEPSYQPAPAPAPEPSYQPAPAQAPEPSYQPAGAPSEVYYKPAPQNDAPKVYYKPIEKSSAPEPKVYYKVPQRVL